MVELAQSRAEPMGANPRELRGFVDYKQKQKDSKNNITALQVALEQLRGLHKT